MTTIAWDGKEVATDTRITYGNMMIPGERAQKVIELPDGRLFCGSGSLEEMFLAYDWFTDGKQDKKPTLECFEGMIVSTSGAEYVGEKLRPWPLTCRYYAIGSGSESACVAMELGKTARQAVALAMKFDCKSGGQIYTFTPKKMVRKRASKTTLKRAA